MKILHKRPVALILIGAVLTSGAFMLGRNSQHNAVLLAANVSQSNAAKVSMLEMQKSKLQSDANTLRSQLTQAKNANDLLQEELVDRPTIIAPGTVKDLDGDAK